jgi:hypothetical protein
MIWRPLAPKGHLTDARELLLCLVRAGLRPALFLLTLGLVSVDLSDYYIMVCNMSDKVNDR